MRAPLQVHVVLVTSTLLIVGCGGSPTSPSNTVDFQGVWQGNWQRTSCTETGGAQGNACSQTPSSGALRLTLTQAGTEAQGSVEFLSLVIPASGQVGASGGLSLGGQVHVQGSAPGTFALSNWNSTRSGNSLNGAFTLTFVADNPSFGSQTLRVTLQGVTKST